MSVYRVVGVNSELEVFEDKLTITPKGALGFLAQGMKGTKTIPFTSITAIQFKEAGLIWSGYLQFSLLGGNESRGGVFAAASDENSFMFSNRADSKHNALMREIKDYIERRIKELKFPTVASSPPQSSSVESRLQQLMDLHAKGLISDEEYQQQRQRIMAEL